MHTIEEILYFAPDGKLERICLAGVANLLHEWEWEVDLGGKFFRPAGWDECFPTIDPHLGLPAMGELVGQAPDIAWFTARVEQTWQHRAYVARRSFALTTPSCLEMSFSVTNRQNHPLEFLWASHALFGLRHLVTARWRKGTWSSDIATDGTENKLFVAGASPVELVYTGYRITMTTDQPWWGIWINCGGWPVNFPKPLWCLGIEATNTPGEHPDGQWLQAGATFSGKVKLEIHSEL